MNTASLELDKIKIIDLAENIDPHKSIENDKDLWEERSKLYNAILADYQKSIRDTLSAKKFYKIITYIVVMLIMISITTVMIVLIFKFSSLEMTKWLAAIIPLMISFLTVFIVIPKIITNYLFDKDEENHMLELLKLLIEHDRR